MSSETTGKWEKWKVGDRVRAKNKAIDGKVINCEGTIKKINTEDPSTTHGHSYAIEFDENIDGHNCGGVTKMSHGWNGYSSELIRIGTEMNENGDYW